jgi:hypothetical protein
MRARCLAHLIVQGDKKVSVHLMIYDYSTKTRKNILNTQLTIWRWTSQNTHSDVDRAILNTVFENTIRRVNKCP